MTRRTRSVFSTPLAAFIGAAGLIAGCSLPGDEPSLDSNASNLAGSGSTPSGGSAEATIDPGATSGAADSLDSSDPDLEAAKSASPTRVKIPYSLPVADKSDWYKTISDRYGSALPSIKVGGDLVINCVQHPKLTIFGDCAATTVLARVKAGGIDTYLLLFHRKALALHDFIPWSTPVLRAPNVFGDSVITVVLRGGAPAGKATVVLASALPSHAADVYRTVYGNKLPNISLPGDINLAAHWDPKTDCATPQGQQSLGLCEFGLKGIPSTRIEGALVSDLNDTLDGKSAAANRPLAGFLTATTPVNASLGGGIMLKNASFRVDVDDADGVQLHALATAHVPVGGSPLEFAAQASLAIDEWPSRISFGGELSKWEKPWGIPLTLTNVGVTLSARPDLTAWAVEAYGKVTLDGGARIAAQFYGSPFGGTAVSFTANNLTNATLQQALKKLGINVTVPAALQSVTEAHISATFTNDGSPTQATISGGVQLNVGGTVTHLESAITWSSGAGLHVSAKGAVKIGDTSVDATVTTGGGNTTVSVKGENLPAASLAKFVQARFGAKLFGDQPVNEVIESLSLRATLGAAPAFAASGKVTVHGVGLAFVAGAEKVAGKLQFAAELGAQNLPIVTLVGLTAAGKLPADLKLNCAHMSVGSSGEASLDDLPEFETFKAQVPCAVAKPQGFGFGASVTPGALWPKHAALLAHVKHVAVAGNISGLLDGAPRFRVEGTLAFEPGTKLGKLKAATLKLYLDAQKTTFSAGITGDLTLAFKDTNDDVTFGVAAAASTDGFSLTGSFKGGWQAPLGITGVTVKTAKLKITGAATAASLALDASFLAGSAAHFVHMGGTINPQTFIPTAVSFATDYRVSAAATLVPLFGLSSAHLPNIVFSPTNRPKKPTCSQSAQNECLRFDANLAKASGAINAHILLVFQGKNLIDSDISMQLNNKSGTFAADLTGEGHTTANKPEFNLSLDDAGLHAEAKYEIIEAKRRLAELHGTLSITNQGVAGTARGVIFDKDILSATGTFELKNGEVRGCVIISKVERCAVLYRFADFPDYNGDAVDIGDELPSGKSLFSKQKLVAADGMYELVMRADGDLILYDGGHKKIWSTETGGHPESDAVRATMRADGDLWVTTKSGARLWQSGTGKIAGSLGQPGARLFVTGLHKAVIVAKGGTILTKRGKLTSQARLLPGESLALGETLSSVNSYSVLNSFQEVILQRDGALIVKWNKKEWCRTGTAGKNAKALTMQPNGNLVLVDVNNKTIWQTNTSGHAGAFLGLDELEGISAVGPPTVYKDTDGGVGIDNQLYALGPPDCRKWH
jgi:hypothetical protein